MRTTSGCPRSASETRSSSKPSAQKYHPFCSSRCAQIDLNRWFGGNYAIPAEEQEPDEGTP